MPAPPRGLKPITGEAHVTYTELKCTSGPLRPAPGDFCSLSGFMWLHIRLPPRWDGSNISIKPRHGTRASPVSRLFIRCTCPGVAMAPFTEENSIFNRVIDKVISPDAIHSLAIELKCDVLEALYPHLDLITQKSSSHIDPLHVHLRKGRGIQITEDASLHLVWHASTVYIKPLPTCLLSLDFWDTNLAPHSPVRAHALGFMRTYAMLLQHRSDFTISQREDLLPPCRDLPYSEFEAFIKHFRTISDHEVSPRWEFGQIRLAWLNWAVRILRPKTATARKGLLSGIFYSDQHQQTRSFLREFGPSLLFIFATLSLILSAMQVVLNGREKNPWHAFTSVSVWFSVVCIIILVLVFLFLLLLVFCVLGLQLGFALKSRRNAKR